jgi:hypothetical protein
MLTEEEPVPNDLPAECRGTRSASRRSCVSHAYRKTSTYPGPEYSCRFCAIKTRCSDGISFRTVETVVRNIRGYPYTSFQTVGHLRGRLKCVRCNNSVVSIIKQHETLVFKNKIYCASHLCPIHWQLSSTLRTQQICLVFFTLLLRQSRFTLWISRAVRKTADSSFITMTHLWQLQLLSSSSSLSPLWSIAGRCFALGAGLWFR